MLKRKLLMMLTVTLFIIILAGCTEPVQLVVDYDSVEIGLVDYPQNNSYVAGKIENIGGKMGDDVEVYLTIYRSKAKEEVIDTAYDYLGDINADQSKEFKAYCYLKPIPETPYIDYRMEYQD